MRKFELLLLCSGLALIISPFISNAFVVSSNNNEKDEYKRCSIKVTSLNSLLKNPEYPLKNTDARSVSYLIQVEDGICGIRISYKHVELSGYYFTTLNCYKDSITVINDSVIHKKRCGDLSNTTENIQVGQLQYVEIAMVLQSKSNLWKIFVEQIPCQYVGDTSMKQYMCGEENKFSNKSNTPNMIMDTEKGDFTQVNAETAETVIDAKFLAQIQTDESKRCKGWKCFERFMNISETSTSSPAALGESLNHNSLQNSVSQPSIWQVMIVYVDESGQRHLSCSASLITSNYVLTVPDCTHPSMSDVSVHNLRVIVAKDRLDDFVHPHEIYHVKQVTAHSGWDPLGYSNEIALLQLDRDVVMNKNTGTICLNSYYHTAGSDHTNTEAQTTGWGTQVHNDPYGTSVQKQDASVMILSNANCEMNYEKYVGGTYSKYFVQPSVICASGKDIDVVCGVHDRGNPLVIKDYNGHNVLVGSFYFGVCRSPTVGGLFIRVSHYLDWINLSLAKATTQEFVLYNVLC